MPGAIDGSRNHMVVRVFLSGLRDSKYSVYEANARVGAGGIQHTRKNGMALRAGENAVRRLWGDQNSKRKGS